MAISFSKLRTYEDFKAHFEIFRNKGVKIIFYEFLLMARKETVNLTDIFNKNRHFIKYIRSLKLARVNFQAIDPHQFKQKQGKKEVLFFSLTNQAA